MISKLLYNVFGYKTIVYATVANINKAGRKRIYKESIGHKSYVTRNADKQGHFIITSIEGTQQNIDLSFYITK